MFYHLVLLLVISVVSSYLNCLLFGGFMHSVSDFLQILHPCPCTSSSSTSYFVFEIFFPIYSHYILSHNFVFSPFRFCSLQIRNGSWRCLVSLSSTVLQRLIRHEYSPLLDGRRFSCMQKCGSSLSVRDCHTITHDTGNGA